MYGRREHLLAYIRSPFGCQLSYKIQFLDSALELKDFFFLKLHILMGTPKANDV